MSEERGTLESSVGDEDLDILDDELDLEDETQGDEGVTVDPDAEPPAEPEPPRVSREQRRIQALRRREKEAQDEIKRLRQVNEGLLSQGRPQFQPPVDPQVQRQRDMEAAMRLPPEEQPAFWANLAEQRMEQKLQRQSVETRDMIDQQLFETFRQGNPHADRLAAKVEETLTLARQQGMNPTRRAVYYLLLGQEVDTKRVTMTRQQRRQAERRVASQRTTTNGTGRSTAATPPRQRQEDSIEAVEARLRGVTVGDIWGRQDF